MSDSLDAASFDIDAWIDGIERPTVTVELYPRDDEFRARVAKLEAAIDAAEKVTAENRAMNDASPEALAAQLDELRAERAASVLPVTVQQLTKREIAKTLQAFNDRGDDDGTTDDMWVVAAACQKPTWTPQQLQRLRDRDRTGERMVAQLMVAVAEIQQGFSVPS